MRPESCHCLPLHTFGQSDDTRNDDEDQSKHLDEGQGDLSAGGHGDAPAVDRHHKRCRHRTGSTRKGKEKSRSASVPTRGNPTRPSESLTHSEETDQPHERHGCRARRKERLHHVSAEGQAHVGGHSWPAQQEESEREIKQIAGKHRCIVTK